MVAHPPGVRHGEETTSSPSHLTNTLRDKDCPVLPCNFLKWRSKVLFWNFRVVVGACVISLSLTFGDFFLASLMLLNALGQSQKPPLTMSVPPCSEIIQLVNLELLMT